MYKITIAYKDGTYLEDNLQYINEVFVPEHIKRQYAYRQFDQEAHPNRLSDNVDYVELQHNDTILRTWYYPIYEENN